MLRRRLPVTLLKGTIGLGLAVLLIAPVAVLWSLGPMPEPGAQGAKKPLQMGGPNGYPPEALATEIAFMQRSRVPAYERANPVWTPEMGSPRLGRLGVGELSSPDTIILPMGKGAFHSNRPVAVADALKRDRNNDPQSLKGDYFIAQLDSAAVNGKGNDEVRKALAATGAELLEFVPNRAFLVRVKPKDQNAFQASPLFSYVGAYEPAYKIDPALGRGRYYSSTRAASNSIDLVIRLHRGEPTAALERDIIHGGGTVSPKTVLDNGQTVIGATVKTSDVAMVAKHPEVFQIFESPQWKNLALTTSIQTEMGRLIDPRTTGGTFVRPFYAENIDGGGTYVTDPNQIPGCTPFDPNTGTVDPNCYLVAPQFVGLADNGISMDAAPLAHSRTSPCTSPSNCSGLSTGSGVGSNHRKVEVYVSARDKDHNTVTDDPNAEGDFLSCDAIDSGGDTHGQIVAATMLGNPSDGQFGLGFHFSDADNSNQFFSYFSDSNEKNLPLDGQAPGARLLFIDAQGNGSPVSGPPPCATNLLSDVNTGNLVLDEVQALAFRWDLNGIGFVPPATTLIPRGAKIIVLPFGSPNFDNNVFNGQNTYAGNAQDIDRFLFANRRILTVVPVGNDGADPNTGIDVDPFTPTDANDTYTADDIQVNNLASGKNVTAVGSNNTDTISLSVAPTDQTEFINRFSSKGPATFDSGRIAPLVVAPGSEPSIGQRAREGAFSDDFFESHTVIVSFDDDQSGSVELVRNQGKIGTSLSAGKVGGAAAQIRDYFAKGYYPTGIRGGTSRNDVSGPLVKALLAGSADFAQSALLADCQNKFCIQQGYGKVELANILPLKSYSTTRRPINSSLLSNQPDTPNNIAVADELWDGGLSGQAYSSGATTVGAPNGFGVVPLGGRKEFNFHMDHGGASMRAVLAYYDKDGEMLNNNLDLEILDPDFDESPGTNPPAGRGVCAPNSWRLGVPGFPDISCGDCTIAGYEVNPNDPTNDTYFNASGLDPWFRRFMGNNFRDRAQFSHHAECDPNTGALDPAGPDSVKDTSNTTEMVQLYYINGSDILGPTAIGANQGTGSSGNFRAVVSFPNDPNKIEVGAPNTPCIIKGGGTSVAGPTDVLLTTADGLSYIASGVDDPNTTGTDEAQCNSTLSGSGDTLLVPSGQIGQPFALVVTGPISYGTNKRSKIETDKNVYDCSDTAMFVTVNENTLPAPSTTTVGGATTIQVLNASGTPVDTEAGMAFVNSPAPSGFRIWRSMNYLSESKRVQYIGGLTPPRNPVANNGLVEVSDGQTIRAIYNDPDGLVSTTARVSCQPNINDAFVLLTDENAHAKLVSGGCDIGRANGLRGDFNFDAKEKLQYQVFFANHSSTILNDVKATLTCENPAGSNNPCQYLTIVDPVQNIGRLPFGREGGAAWHITVAEALRADVLSNTLPIAERVVIMHVAFSATNSDFGGQLATQSFSFREALQADNERLFYDTDRPGGTGSGNAYVDYNRNGLIEARELANGGVREEREVRKYQTWSGTSNSALSDPNQACGASPCIPFSFDSNDGFFTTRANHGVTADSKPGTSYPFGTQGWFYGTGGACGWQSQGGSLPASPKGVWHAGFGPIQSIVAAGVCGTYFMPSDVNTSRNTEFVHFALRSPVFNKVNTGLDPRGFSYDVRMENLAWNSNEAIQDASAKMYIQIDTNIDDDTPIILGESYVYRPPFNVSGPRLNSVRGARRFGPTFDPSPTFGDEIGQPAPLAAYDAFNFLQRPNLPYPATDSDSGSPGFQSDERLSTGLGTGPCPTVANGQPCRSAGFTNPAGPVRNRDVDTGASFEDFNGASGTHFQFEMNWQLTEGGTGAAGWTIDDVRFEWSEQHPADQGNFTAAADGGCSIDGTSGFPAGTQGTCLVTTVCSGGPRNGLFCRGVGAEGDRDCRLVATEGVCDPTPAAFGCSLPSTNTGTCTAGAVGKSCCDKNDCDLGTCVSGNTELGCTQDSDCTMATNDCDAIHVRNVGSAAFGASQCASISFEKLFTYDCTSSLKVTVQDDTPNLCTNVAAPFLCTGSPRKVLVNARSLEEPLGEDYALAETSPSSGIFIGDVQISGSNDQKGILFLQSNPAENTNLVVSYDDTTCDLDADAIVNESDFKDIDGDGVKNFGVDNALGDQDPNLTYIGGGKVSDDDNCFDGLNALDTYNPVGQSQIDFNNNGFLDPNDCVVDAIHNKTGQCDHDNDGVGDICDNCPSVANSDQQDTDSDGVGDICEVSDIDHDGFPNVGDNCPTVYNPTQNPPTLHGGGSRFNRGTLCDSSSDLDGDGIDERVDNCPNEELVEDGGNGFEPYHSDFCPTPGTNHACTYNPDQRDTDSDGIGDVCDSEDFDHDGVINTADNCATVYNPADAAFQVQADSDGDGQGDDRKNQDTVGVCQVGNANAGKQCYPVGSAADCITGSTGAFCTTGAAPYCDFDGTDDNNNGVPDDLTQFTSQINCMYGPGGLGTPALEIAGVSLAAVQITDDGTADPVCQFGAGDPNPNNDPAIREQCPGRTNAECDSPGSPGTGICIIVADGVMDPGELSSVRLTVANQTLDQTNAPRTLTNVRLGIRSASPTIGCVPKATTFVGTLPTTGTVTTAAGALTFIVDPNNGNSTLSQFAEAEFIMTVLGDGIEGNAPDQTFKAVFDIDVNFFPPIANACGGTKLPTGLSGRHLFVAGVCDSPGTGLCIAPSDPSKIGALCSNNAACDYGNGFLCEDFDTDRNLNGTFQWTRLYPTFDPNDPGIGVTDPNDDVLGHSVDGGPVPFGVSGQMCSTDTGFAAARATCHVVPSENDWHLHSRNEGCDSTYGNSGGFATNCAPAEKAHSGFRSMHMGRHLDPLSTLGDTYRMRQVSAFIMDPVNLGTNTTLDFWHIISVCDDKCNNAGAGGTFAGGQIQLSLLNLGNGLFDPWQRLTPTQNGYNSIAQNIVVICEFDPGDDQNPPLNETTCGNQPQWSDMGDVYGNDRTCIVDQDGNDPTDKDCGSTSNRTVDTGCTWVTDPSCGSFLENGTKGTGVWAREQFNLSAFSGRRARLRWIDQMGGGWSFGESRSFLEPEPGFLPTQAFDLDDGWWVDDIVLTDIRDTPAAFVPDPSTGFAVCTSQGDPNNCGSITVNVAGTAVDTRTGGNVLRAQSGDLRTGITLDARTSTATPTAQSCLSGVLEFQWSELDSAGNTVRVIQPFASKGNIIVAIDKDTTYKVDVRCSSDEPCAGSKTFQAQVYTGDGSDINNAQLDATGQPLDGLRIDHDPNTNIATLTWRARPQVTGENGYDVFKKNVASSGTDDFAGGVFVGGACITTPPVAQGAAGAIVTKTDSVMPAAKNASLYMVGHSSNNTLGISPLGFRPSVSNRANQLVSAAVNCPN